MLIVDQVTSDRAVGVRPFYHPDRKKSVGATNSQEIFKYVGMLL